MYRIIPQPLTTADNPEEMSSTSMYQSVQFVVGEEIITSSLVGAVGSEEISSENEANFYEKIEMK